MRLSARAAQDLSCPSTDAGLPPLEPQRAGQYLLPHREGHRQGLEKLVTGVSGANIPTMRRTLFAAVVLLTFMLPDASRADVPATEFFVTKTNELMKLAPTDTDLDALSGVTLAKISTAHGWYGRALAMTFSTATFRIYARFGDVADFTRGGPTAIEYHIDASNDQTSWDVASVEGRAMKLGKQFITENWRTQPTVVILRFLDLKH